MILYDMLGKVVAVGDHIVYSGPAGTGSSKLYAAEVVELVPIIPHPNGEPGRFVRQDQLNKSSPTRFWQAGIAIKVKKLTGDKRGASLTRGQAANFAKVSL